ncbi:MAG: copper amine oxidase N-terminal domain-containing protein [Paludibacter sp.]|nr:copper amine oxidase N-terminal domain-containing protein [Paludibacter sp.]
MKRFSTGLIVGLVAGLIMATAALALAANPIKLIINGQNIQCDVPPQNINGRVLVPARFVAESLGANVAWDAANNAVVITSVTPSLKVGNQEVKITETTFNGMRAIIVNGQTYFNAGQYAEILRNGELNPKNKISFDQDSKISTIYIDEDLIKIPFTDENIQIYKGQTYFNTRFYR